MKRKLIYNGKYLSEMTKEELKAQLKINQTRIKYRNIFFLLVALACVLSNPILSMIPIFITIITSYWLLENNVAIQEELKNK